MKEAVLLVSFGTSHHKAREKSLDKICMDLSAVSKERPVYQAYTSGMILKELRTQGIEINTVEEAIKEALGNHVKCLYVIPTHMIPGAEFHKMMQILDPYKASFEKIETATAVLDAKEDCEALIPILNEIMEFRAEHEYILMGHGTFADANIRYQQMNEALWQAGFDNVHIASVEAEPGIEDAIHMLQKKKTKKKIIVHPFMVVAGDHAVNDMAGVKDSYLTRLMEKGYDARAVIKGLGEYAQFRSIYVNKLKALLDGGPKDKK